MVASGAQVLANQRSARANAVAGLVGGARWCVVDREDMSTVESASERLRVRRSSITAIGIRTSLTIQPVQSCWSAAQDTQAGKLSRSSLFKMPCVSQLRDRYYYYYFYYNYLCCL